MKKDGLVALSLGTLLRGVLYHVMCLLVSLGALAVVPSQASGFLDVVPTLPIFAFLRFIRL